MPINKIARKLKQKHKRLKNLNSFAHIVYQTSCLASYGSTLIIQQNATQAVNFVARENTKL